MYFETCKRRWFGTIAEYGSIDKYLEVLRNERLNEIRYTERTKIKFEDCKTDEDFDRYYNSF